MASAVPKIKRPRSTTDKKWYVQRFNKKWLANPVYKRWLIEVESDCGSSSAKCKYCDSVFNNPNKSALDKHVTSAKHKMSMHKSKRQSSSKLSFSPKSKMVNKDWIKSCDVIVDMEKQLTISQLKLAGYMAEHDIPFNQAEHLCLLLPSLCPDSIIPKGMEVMGTTKASCIIQHGIATREKEELVETLKKQKFSIMVDEATAQSVPQVLAVAAKYFDEIKSESVNCILGIIEVEEATAAGLFNAIQGLLEQYEIPMSNIIGLATDNCASLMGSESGFQALMKQNIHGLFVIGCFSHSISLCANYASRCLPSWVENLLCDIEEYLLHTSNRTCELQLIAEVLKHPSNKILKLSTTRKTSHNCVISSVVEHFEALKLFFETEQAVGSQEDKDQKEKVMKIFRILTSAGTEHMFLFLNYILEKVDNMNKLFQAEGELIYNVHSKMKKFCVDLLNHFIYEDVVLDAENDRFDLGNDSIGIRKPLKDVALGEQCMQKLISEPLGENEVSFRQIAVNFLAQLAIQIGNVFEVSDSSTLAIMKCYVDPAVAVDLSDKRPVSLMPLAMKLPAIFGEKNADILDDQWLHLPVVKDSLEKAMDPVAISNCPPGMFWKTVRDIKDFEGTSIFLELGQFMCDILALPLSTAAVESIFSEVNTHKVTIPNKLHVTTLENRLLAMQHVKKNGGCHLWKPHHSLIKAVMNGVCHQRYAVFMKQNEEKDLDVPYDIYK